MPDGKLIYTNKQYYTSTGYLPSYVNIQYQVPTLLMSSTLMPEKNTDTNYNIPLPINKYPRWIICLALMGHDLTSYPTIIFGNTVGYIANGNDAVKENEWSRWYIMAHQVYNTTYTMITSSKQIFTSDASELTNDSYITLNINDTTWLSNISLNFVIF